MPIVIDASKIPQSSHVLGIDLGTTNSTISVWDDEEEEVRVLNIGNEKIMPSVVSFMKQHDEMEELVGVEAKNRAVSFPEETVISVKDHMGTEKQYEILEEKYTPEQIASKILLKLKAAALENTDFKWGDEEGLEITQAIITVPANFDPKQIRGTIEAGTQANFITYLDVLKEPVAAALAYGLERVVGEQTVLVYDFGGGTFDVAIIQVNIPEGRMLDKSQLDPKWYGGDNNLGGDDIDEILMNYINDEFRAQRATEINIMNLDADDGISKKMKRQAQQNLKNVAERTKIDLGELETVPISQVLVKDESGAPLNVEIEITREKFNELIEAKIARTIEVMDETIQKAGLTKEQIDRVIVVGGSSNIPLVEGKLIEYYGKRPFADIDTSTIISQGAAIWGHMVKMVGNAKPIVLNDKAPYTIGLGIFGNRFAPLIESGTDIPDEGFTCETRKFYNPVDNIPEIRVEVYKQMGEGRFIDDVFTTEAGEERNAFDRIGRVIIPNLPAKPAGEIEIEVVCSITRNGELLVNATYEGTPYEIKGSY